MLHSTILCYLNLSSLTVSLGIIPHFRPKLQPNLSAFPFGLDFFLFDYFVSWSEILSKKRVFFQISANYLVDIVYFGPRNRQNWINFKVFQISLSFQSL